MELGMNGAAWPQSKHLITNDISKSLDDDVVDMPLAVSLR
jgi:hypothetical protein